MSTTSTPEQNDPNADNRAEYSVPPIVPDDGHGLVLEVDEDGFTTYLNITEVVESDDSVAS